MCMSMRRSKRVGSFGVCVLGNPAIAAKSAVALDAFTGDAILYAAALDVCAASRTVVPLVRVQLARPAAWRDKPTTPSQPTTAISADEPFSITCSFVTMAVMGKYT